MSEQHIFISYARKDGSEHAARLDAELHKLGFKTWRDTRGVDPTQDFTTEIEKAIKAASYVVVCLTRNVLRDSSFVRREIAYALIKKKRIVVARFANLVPPISVITHTQLDFFKDWEKAFERLQEIVQMPVGKYQPPPPKHVDQYQIYLEALYETIVEYLDKTVISVMPDKEIKISVIERALEDNPDAVEPPPTMKSQALPMAFFDLAGIDSDEENARKKAPVTSRFGVKRTGVDSDEENARRNEPYKDFHTAFARYQGRVLLLGEPGGGKTTTLFAFARDKVAERLEKPDKPLPILAPIVTWNAEEQQSLAEWLSQAVPILSDDIASILLEGKALLLLDGLDELGREREDGKTKEKYDPRLHFMNVIPKNNQLLITCRVEDYAKIGAKLALQGAVTLRPLDNAQMQAYLRDLPELWRVLRNDIDLLEVARIPLLLSFFAYAFTGLDDEAKVLGNLSRGDVRDKIFETYIYRRYQWEERRASVRGENLAFTLVEIRNILGEVALKSRLEHGRFGRDDNIFNVDDFIPPLLDKIQYQSLIEIATHLHILVSVGNNRFRFIHKLLHDYFTFSMALVFLNSDSPKQRQLSVETLGASQDSRAFEPLINALGDVSPNVELTIFCVLSEIGTPRTAEALTLKLGTHADILRLIEIFRIADNVSRPRVVKALMKLRDIRTIEPLLIALAGMSVPERIDFDLAISELKNDEHTVNSLMATLTNDDPRVRSHAMVLIGRLADVRALEITVKTLGDVDSTVRCTAAIALGVLKNKLAVNPLIHLLADEDINTCYYAAMALRQIGTPKALTAFKKWQRKQKKLNLSHRSTLSTQDTIAHPTRSPTDE